MNVCAKCGMKMKESTPLCKSCGSDPVGANNVLSEKRRRLMNGKKSWGKMAAVTISAVVLFAAIGFWLMNRADADRQTGMRPEFAPRNEQSARVERALIVKADGGIVRIPRASVEDGNAHFFVYPAKEKSIFFFAMRSADGGIRVAFDACVACNHAKRGYRQEGDHVVCNNCGMGFMPAEIGKLTDGCNPIVLRTSMEGPVIKVTTKDLEAGASYF
jgi:hypothetical protein